MRNVRYSCHISDKIDIYHYILIKLSGTKFHENSFSVSQVLTWDGTGRETLATSAAIAVEMNIEIRRGKKMRKQTIHLQPFSSSMISHELRNEFCRNTHHLRSCFDLFEWRL
jgi:hypothetical protein